MIADGPAAKRPPHMAFAPCCAEPALPELSPVSLKFASLALGSLLLLAGGCDRQSDRQAQPPAGVEASGEAGGKVDRSHAGAALPDLVVRDPAGRELRLAGLKGPLLVNLWATWCAPCVTELPTLNALAGQGKVRVLTVSEDLGEPAKVAEFLKARRLDRLEPWLDPNNDATVKYQAQSLPVTIFYGADGREKWRITGGHDWTGKDMQARLAE
ncbi:MAG: TlpA family protein disulfide reductase [Sphingomonadales bacterium]|nr:TlpA family protein disulfide reductase [Sphingomonadales bacterium]